MAWLIGWNRRKPKLVKGSTAGAQTNYQLKLTVYKGSGIDTVDTIYLGGYVNNDFSDLRFTSSDETTLLPYWIESYISGVSAIVWIKIDSIPADPFSKFIYIYYDNLIASPVSNAATTFPVPTTATGGTITYDNAYAVHFFTNSGTFTPSFSGEVKITAWGGGGGGAALAGWAQRGVGGAGSGEVIEAAPVSVTSGTPYPVTIGAGGAGGWAATWTGAGIGVGGNTTFSSLISVEGGKCSSFVAAANMSGGAGGGLTGAIGYPAWISTPTDYNGRMGTTSGYRTGGSSGGNFVYASGLIGSGGNMLGLNGVTYYGGGTAQSGTNYAGGGAAGYMGNGTAGVTTNGGWSASAAPNSGAGAGAGSVGASQAVGAGNGGSGGLIVRYINRKYASPEPIWDQSSSEQTYTANLTVSSTPSGAEIWINDIYQGVTTGWFILNPGTYTIILTKPGYQNYIEIIVLSSNQNAIIDGILILGCTAPVCNFRVT